MLQRAISAVGGGGGTGNIETQAITGVGSAVFQDVQNGFYMLLPDLYLYSMFCAGYIINGVHTPIYAGSQSTVTYNNGTLTINNAYTGYGDRTAYLYT